MAHEVPRLTRSPWSLLAANAPNFFPGPDESCHVLALIYIDRVAWNSDFRADEVLGLRA